MSFARSTGRVERVRHELRRRDVEVLRVERIGASFVDITFGGDSLATFVSDGFDDHVSSDRCPRLTTTSSTRRPGLSAPAGIAVSRVSHLTAVVAEGSSPHTYVLNHSKFCSIAARTALGLFNPWPKPL